MSSIKAGWARPMRTSENSRNRVSMVFFILPSVSFKMSLAFITSPIEQILRMLPHNGPYLFPEHRSFDVAFLQKVENDDGQRIVHAHADRGGVHHLQIFLEHIQELQFGKFLRVLVLGRVGGINT